MTKLITKKWSMLSVLMAMLLCCFQHDLSAQCGEGETGVDIIVDTTVGGNDDEIGWSLIDDAGTVVASLDCETNASVENTVATTSVCLVEGNTYTFQAFDTFGDGWGGSTAQIVGNSDGEYDGCVYVETFAPTGLNAALPASAGDLCVSEGDSFPNEMEAEVDFTPGEFSDNISVVGIATSNVGCGLTDAEVITVSISNGCNAVAAEQAEVTITVADGPNGSSEPITELLPAIDAGETLEFDLATTFDFSAIGSYAVDVSVNFTAASGLEDSNPADNEVLGIGVTNATFFSSIDGESPDYVESFEDGEGDWSTVDVGTGATSMTLGSPTVAPLDGTQAWFHDGGYNSSELVFFQTGCFDMSCMEAATFSIDISFDTESAWDGATIGYNTDGGTTFNILGVDDGADTGTSDGTGVNWYNDPDVDGIADGIAGWSGTGNGWETATHDISFLAGFSSVRFAVIFGSDGSLQPGDGFAWDNVQIIDATTAAACLGCTDMEACNYDPAVTYDDASCEFTSCAGCMDMTACNYDEAATIDDGSCDFSCLGCMDMTACNYDAEATIDDGSCNFGTCGDGVCDIACGEDVDGCVDCAGTVLGCMDAGACNYNPDATVDDDSCEFTSCAGCTDMNACNYDVLATIDDGSCIVGSCGNGICEPVCGETVSNCNDCAIRLGCTDTGAHNYSPRATDDDPDNPCETCDDGIMNGDEVAVDCGGALCGPCDAGCMDPDAHNYDEMAAVDDGSCETCADGIMNGDETGVDCGGSNPNCGICGDLCINALDIACGDLMSGDTNDNTGDDVPANCGGVNNPDEGAWYTFTGTGENVVLSTDHSGTDGFDTNLQVYEGSCDALTCVDGDEDGGDVYTSGWTSELTVETTPGTNYYVYVGGYQGGQGAYELSMDCFFPLDIAVDGVIAVPASVGTGSVSVTVTGGNTDCGPLTHAWTGPGGYTASTASISDITDIGDYTLTVTDCLGNEASVTVNVPAQTRGRGRGRKAGEIVASQFQAAPNPFANLTTISFEVNTEERVSLDVFDIRGAKVATLFNGTTEAGQNYQVQFGESMPSGTYIAKLTTSNGQIQHIKLFLTK